MIIAIDFDGTVVSQERRYDDVESPLQLLPGAKEALEDLRRAGHRLLLWSGRSSRSNLDDPRLDPMARAGVRMIDHQRWMERTKALNAARYKQMVEFVAENLPGIFDAIDDGMGGKPAAQLFIDDRAVRYGHGPGALDWDQIAYLYGEPPAAQEPADAAG